jgi:ElaB/YqjD/DUF883 family membrane-anchored ribosome-binding protein
MTTARSSGTSTQGIVDTLKKSAATQLTQQKDKATDGLGSIADAVRQTTQSLRERKQDTVAQYIERAADQLQQFSQRMHDRDLGDLTHEAERFARRQPALFVGAAFAVGVVAARFLKSSPAQSEHREHGYMPPPSTPLQTAAQRLPRGV